MKKEHEIYDTFDTVVVSYNNVVSKCMYKFFLLSYQNNKDTGHGFYNSVFVGKYNKQHYEFMGYSVLRTTRMVLVEKYDYRLIESSEFVSPIKNFIKK